MILICNKLSAIIYLVAHRHFHDVTLEDLRQDVKRTEDVHQTALTLTEFIEKRGDELWADELLEGLGPWLMVQLCDLAAFFEVLRKYVFPFFHGRALFLRNTCKGFWPMRQKGKNRLDEVAFGNYYNICKARWILTATGQNLSLSMRHWKQILHRLTYLKLLRMAKTQPNIGHPRSLRHWSRRHLFHTPVVARQTRNAECRIHLLCALPHLQQISRIPTTCLSGKAHFLEHSDTS
jgi:hypothetical protein